MEAVAQRKRRPYDHVMPEMNNLIRYVDACSHWRTALDLSTQFGLTRDAVSKMAKRLVRHGVLQAREVRGGNGELEFLATHWGQGIFDGIMDGSIEMGLHPTELGAGPGSSRDVA